MKVDLHDRLEAVGSAAWDDLLARSGVSSPFLGWIWQEHWARAFAGERRLEVRTVVDDAGRLVAILPLVEAEPGLLQFVGGVDVSDYLDLIVEAGREEEAWTALLASRGEGASSGICTRSPRPPTRRPRCRELAGELGGVVTVAVEERCPILALPPSWDAYLARLSGKHRHEVAGSCAGWTRGARGARRRG